MDSINTLGNPKLAQQKFANRQKLLEYLEAEELFSNPARQARFKTLCLSLFDHCDCLFSQWQLTILIQVTAFAIARNVQIYKIKTEGELAVSFDTKTHLLKVVFNSGADLYETDLIHKLTGQSMKNEDVYAEDFIEIMDLIKAQALANSSPIIAIKIK